MLLSLPINVLVNSSVSLLPRFKRGTSRGNSNKPSSPLEQQKTHCRPLSFLRCCCLQSNLAAAGLVVAVAVAGNTYQAAAAAGDSPVADILAADSHAVRSLAAAAESSHSAAGRSEGDSVRKALRCGGQKLDRRAMGRLDDSAAVIVVA